MVVFNIYMIDLSLVMLENIKGAIKTKLFVTKNKYDNFNEPQQCIYTYLFTYAGVEHDFHI